MKKGEVTPRLFVFGSIIFVFIVVGMVSIMSDFYKDNPSFINDAHFIDFNDSFNKYSDVIEANNTFAGSINNAKAEKGLFGVLDSLINAVWSSIKNIFITMDFMSSAFWGFSTVFGVPSWAISLLSTLIVVMFAFSIYSLIFQGRA